MTLTRPAVGAPFDKRLTAELLTQLLQAGPRAFNQDTDVDLFDAIEQHVASHLAQYTGNGAAIAGLFYAANSLDAVVVPGTLKVSSWASLGRPASTAPVTLTVGQTFPVFDSKIAGSGGPYAQSGPLKMVTGDVVTLPLTLAAPGHAETLRFTWHAHERGFYGIGLFPASATRYTLELLNSGGNVVQTWANVIPSATGALTRQSDYGTRTYMPQTVQTSHVVNADLAAGAYSLRITALEVLPRTNRPAGQPQLAGDVDANTYPALFFNAGYAVVNALSAAPINAGVQVHTDALYGMAPATLPEVALDLILPAFPASGWNAGTATLSGDTLAVIPATLGPSAAEQIAAVEFTLSPDPDPIRAAWGASFGLSLALLADDLLHHDLDRIAEGTTLRFERPAGAALFGGVLAYGVRYRVECRVLFDGHGKIILTAQFYNATSGAALGAADAQPLVIALNSSNRPYHLPQQNATLPPASVRLALVTFPSAGPWHGYPARVQVHSWREARL